MNPAKIERELLRLSNLLEQRTEELAKLSHEAAEWEVAHKREVALATIALIHEKLTVDQRTAKINESTEAHLRDRLLAEAARDSTLEAVRSLRSQLSALQSILRSAVPA